ncbi:gamma-aminobutyric acid receptor subunit beta-1 isoform X1 [Hydra vulgaris]|uniref:gamma-aminobutyric acid receptor subunit beta-1 isoform X1 n=1 Tax=Hydra vulgaris TaxID=6087 RepID=UPI000640C371|nr:gamma-aminobutyric acid receptor subunit beta-1 isoform X1 [Hydra vulgaris]
MMKLLIFQFLLLCNIKMVVLKRELMYDNEIYALFENLFLNYNRMFRPNYYGKPVEVLVDASILSFSKVDASKMIYTADMFLRQRWNDYRLRHNMSEKLTLIVGTNYPSDIIWTPDTVFINSVNGLLHSVTVNNNKLDIHPNGDVFWGTRVTVSPACDLDLQDYPKDVQKCTFSMKSYSLSSRHISYKWMKDPGIFIPKMPMAQFKLIKYSTERYVIGDATSNFTQLYSEFRLKRLAGFAIFHIFIPTTSIVITSWISMWLPLSASAARIGLSGTAMVTIANIWMIIDNQLPAVNYLKKIDVYLIFSLVNIVLTMLEYAVVLNISVIAERFRKKKVKRKYSRNDRRLTTNIELEQIRQSSEMKNIQWGHKRKKQCDRNIEKENVRKLAQKIEMKNAKIARKIEMTAQVFIPLTFIIFNIFYWVFYMKSDEIGEIQTADVY